MGILDNIKSFFTSAPTKEAWTELSYQPPVMDWFDGEKNFGEMGHPVDYTLNYENLAVRSWQAYTENDVAEMLINEYLDWVIGKGLRLESTPEINVLDSEGIALTNEAALRFSNLSEARFKVHTGSRYSVFSKEMNLHQLVREVKKNAMLSGDCLVVLRVFKNGGVNAQMIDGRRVQTPHGASVVDAKEKGNEIINGIEQSKSGAHVAYWVANPRGGFTRIAVKGEKTKRTQAFMVYHRRYKNDYNRGIGLLTPILEKLQKLDRYTEAVVGSAEERAKIVYQIVHGALSTGANPNLSRIGVRTKNADTSPTHSIQDTSAQFIKGTSSKETYNMEPGSELKALESKAELSFEEFFTANLRLICSARGIPPEVALKEYNSNYSASRMATKSWEHTLGVQRWDLTQQFYKPFYNTWLHLEILGGRISAPGYVAASTATDKNHMITESYSSAKFVGINVPSVDPVKDVRAEREKLGPLGANVPLTTPEKATEQLGTGDATENARKFDAQTKQYKTSENGSI